jgi:hypothetical protein
MRIGGDITYDHRFALNDSRATDALCDGNANVVCGSAVKRAEDKNIWITLIQHVKNNPVA